MQVLCQFGLGQIAIFPQIPDSFIHVFITLAKFTLYENRILTFMQFSYNLMMKESIYERGKLWIWLWRIKMKSILADLYEGKLHPDETIMPTDPEYRRNNREISNTIEACKEL